MTQNILVDKDHIKTCEKAQKTLHHFTDMAFEGAKKNIYDLNMF